MEDSTYRALRKNAYRAEKLAAERVRTEVEKTLLSSRPERVKTLFDLGLMTAWNTGEIEDTDWLAQLPEEALLRWAGLCACRNADDAEHFLRDMRLDGVTIRACGAGYALWRAGIPATEQEWRLALIQLGVDGCRAAAAMEGAVPLVRLERVLAQDPCIRPEQLAISGGELAGLGLSGPEIGRMQQWLLTFVAAHPEANTRARLLAEIEK